MVAITDRSTKQPLLKLGNLTHGTLHVRDIVKSRRFYEEVLGLECIQTSAASLMFRKGTDHVYAVVEQPAGAHPSMSMINHNGFEVGSKEELEAAKEMVTKVKDDYGIKKILPISHVHGDSSFYFQDLDDNWWEIGFGSAKGYIRNFGDKENADLTGRHDLDDWVALFLKERKLRHVHDPETRELMKAARKA